MMRRPVNRAFFGAWRWDVGLSIYFGNIQLFSLIDNRIYGDGE